MVPSIHLEYLLMIPRKCPCWLALPENPSTCTNKVVVKHPLVERALPAPSINSIQRLPTLLHPLEAITRAKVGHTQVILEGRPFQALLALLSLLFQDHPIVGLIVLGEGEPCRGHSWPESTPPCLSSI